MFDGLLDDVLDARDSRRQRRQQRQAPVFRARQYFELEDFHQRFRLSRTQVEDLMQHIGQHIEGQTLRTSALSVQDKVLMTLRHYASGAIYTAIADANGPSTASVTRAIKCLTRAINEVLFQETIRFPQNTDALRLAFYNVNQPNGMPMVFGCVDGTLINIIAPSDDEFQHVDRKSDHSINAMFVCGPSLRFFAASVRWPGSVHDARVFRDSALAQRLEGGWRPFENAVLLGDSGYKTRDYLLTPLANPQSPAERRYNAAHKKTRRVIECVYGVFKNSFLCLKRLRHKDPVFCCEVIKACAAIHNLRTPEDYVASLEDAMNNMGFEMEDDDEDDEDDMDHAGAAAVGAGDNNVSDDNVNNVPPTQAAARAAAPQRLRTMVDAFRRRT